MSELPTRRRATADEFTAAFREHPGGVAVITADIGDGPVGLTATSVSSVSIDPPLLVVSVSDRSSTSPVLTRADTLVVHLLGAAQLHLARLCATSGIDRFADTSLWSRLETGEPYFTEARSRILGRVIDRVTAGTAQLLVVEALEIEQPAASAADDALVYHHRAWHRLSEHSVVS
jgi:flavin reductase (DIM6/NTAB) family NADH-FMN oxidoreductase RutF